MKIFLPSDIGEVKFLRAIKELNAVFILNFSPPDSFYWYEEISNRLKVSLPVPSMCVDDIFG